MKRTSTTSTVIHYCGHEDTYDLALTPPLLRAAVANHLAQRDCLSCRRATHARLSSDVEVSNPSGSRETGETGSSEIDAWERRLDMPELEGSERAIAGGSRVRFTLLTEAHDWCSDREWTDEEFTQRLASPAREHLAASWWVTHRDCAPWDLEEVLSRIEGHSGFDGDTRSVRDE
jgi:hypothetical protein